MRIVREYSQPSPSKRPYKRNLTETEREVLREHYPDFLHNLYVDSNDHIVLTRYEGDFRKSYVTTKDLSALVDTSLSATFVILIVVIGFIVLMYVLS